MPPQRYEAVSGDSLTIPVPIAATDVHQVNSHDDDDFDSPVASSNPHGMPSSPPPSFRSRESSPTSRRLLAQDPLLRDADQDLADTFDDGDGSDAENDGDDRQRLMRADPGVSASATDSSPPNTRPPQVERRVTELPAFRPAPRGTGTAQAQANDGVFANLSAKLERGEQLEEKPPVSKTQYENPYILILYRPTNKQLPMLLLHTGKPPSSPPACRQTKSTLTVSQLAPSSPSSGMG
jgi:hypothetical protein